MKRILALDGGGIHGVFALQVLRRIEALLAERYQDRRDFVLADYFDLIAGTSTGAITASMLAWGARVADIEQFYHEHAASIFTPAPLWQRWWRNRYASAGLTSFLQGYFRERDGAPALLGSATLRTKLLIVLRNATTGSPWPLVNNPAARFGHREGDRTSNLELPLWQLIRASSAAPTYFPPERITIGSSGGPKSFEFIDGGISPYNNPAYLAYLVATLPEYCLNFPRGIDDLLVVSVGVGRRQFRYAEGQVQDMHLVSHVRSMIRGLLDAASVQQDLLCRVTGRCLHGAPIDRLLGELTGIAPEEAARRAFSYIRYNHTYSGEEVTQALTESGGAWDLANVNLIPVAIAAGRKYAAEAVDAAHLR
jgi:predicted acylesterase/phospholipase RssA